MAEAWLLKSCLALFRIAGVLWLAACGCDTIGYPAVNATVQDRLTGRPVPLAGAEIAYEGGRQRSYTERRPDTDSSSTFSICCTPGNWRVRVTKPGYAPFDTTVRVRARGRCERPVLVQLLVRLQPQASTMTARIIAPTT
jgi:hypothetical protein